MTSRREFLERAALAAAGLTLPTPRDLLATSATIGSPPTFVDICRPPDAVTVQTASDEPRLARGPSDRWESGSVVVTTTPNRDSLDIQLAAPGVAVKRVHLRWRGRLNEVRLILGDEWERGYGDLEWRGWVPDRVMPWYVAMQAGSLTHAYGVRTRAGALCFWQADPDGISLWADVRSGGVGVELAARTLEIGRAHV